MAVATQLQTTSLLLGVVILVPQSTVLHGRATSAAQVRVYDGVGLRTGDRDRALDAATQLLGTVSVRVTWRQCPAEGDALCQSHLADGERVVRVVNSSGPARSWESKPLGDAVVHAATASSVLATAYANRIESRAGRCGVDPYLLLGRVVAHELRHVLTADTAHSRTGLMRELWTCEELRANRREDWAFPAADRFAILNAFSRR
jgi:hypothetical protein